MHKLIAYLTLLLVPTILIFAVWLLTFKSFYLMGFYRSSANIFIQSAWTILITWSMFKTLKEENEL